MDDKSGGRWEDLKLRIGRWRDGLVELALVLWICRVSLVSTAIGVILFIFVPQVRDTFLEVRTSKAWNLANIAFWAFFLASVLIFWSLPVHYAARRDIEHDRACASKSASRAALWVPRVLGFICILSVAIGAYRAQFGLLDPKDPDFYNPALFQTRSCSRLACWCSCGSDGRSSPMVSARVGTLLMTGLTVAFFVFFLFNLSAFIWRAPLIPLLLGGWVPIFAWLAYESRESTAFRSFCCCSWRSRGLPGSATTTTSGAYLSTATHPCSERCPRNLTPMYGPAVRRKRL
jgi:hypothetical protein